MGVYRDRVLPVLTDLTLRSRPFEQVRARVAAGLDGEVVEVGFGSGRNVPYYPAAVRRVRAVEPAAGGWRLAAGRIAASAVPVEYLCHDAEHLPLPDGSVDHVLTTWTLCSIPDIGRALAEVVRVLRPGGTLHFAEHGRSPDPAVARWQDRLTPIQRRLFGGCHLNRPIDQLISGAGLEVVRLQTYAIGPATFGYTFEGLAAKP